MKAKISETPKLWHVAYYLLPITPSKSNTYHTNIAAMSEDEARRIFLARHKGNYRISYCNKVKRKS